jgi:hypothetical protein
MQPTKPSPEPRRADPAPPVRDNRRPQPAFSAPAPPPMSAGISRRGLAAGLIGAGLIGAGGLALVSRSAPTPPIPPGPAVIATYRWPLPIVAIATEAERERTLATWLPMGPEAAARLSRDVAAGLVRWHEIVLVDDVVEDGDQVAVSGPYTAATVTIRHAPTRLIIPIAGEALITISYVWTPDRIATMAIATTGGPLRPAPLRPGQAFAISPLR